jgi:hypothetical protein
LAKLGYRVGRSTISAVLKRHRIPSAPTRDRGASWSSWYRHYGLQVLASDFLQVETLSLRTLFVLFFIKVRTHSEGASTQPEVTESPSSNEGWD